MVRTPSSYRRARRRMGIESPKSYQNSPADRCLGKFPAPGRSPLHRSPRAVSCAGPPCRLPVGVGHRDQQGCGLSQHHHRQWIPEDSVLVGSFDSGQLDFAWPRVPTPAQTASLIKQSGNVVFSRPYPGISDLLVPNVSPGKDPGRSHRATALQESIDRQQYATTVFYDGLSGGHQPARVTTPDAANLSKLLAYNPKAAEAALTKRRLDRRRRRFPIQGRQGTDAGRPGHRRRRPGLTCSKPSSRRWGSTCSRTWSPSPRTPRSCRRRPDPVTTTWPRATHPRGSQHPGLDYRYGAGQDRVRRTQPRRRYRGSGQRPVHGGCCGRQPRGEACGLQEATDAARQGRRHVPDRRTTRGDRRIFQGSRPECH